MSAASVLRLGPFSAEDAQGGSSASVASVLKDALVSHFRSKDCDDGGHGDGDILPIRNKYFSAGVALKSLDAGGADVGTGGKEDGIVLVFSADGGCGQGAIPSAPHSSFDSLPPVHDAAVASGQDGSLLRLCVGASLSGPVPAPDGKAAEEEYSRRVLWCLDRGYEYVEADLSEKGIRSGHDEREKEGFARIVEAVESTVWSCASMQPRAGGVASRAKTEVVTNQAQLKEEPSIRAVGEANKTEGGAMPTKAKCDDTAICAESIASGGPKQGMGSEDEDSDAIFDDLEKVIREASKVRADAKSGLLSDEERRKRAGDVAMMLSGLLGNMDFDESDDESGDG